jgi:3-oxoacyl-[acyl-carrier protein] reductase
VHKELANQLTEYAASRDQKAVAIPGDLTIEAEANALVEKTVKALGGLNIRINNAGSLVARKLLSEMETDFWHKVMDINLTSMMFVTRAASPYLAPEYDGFITGATLDINGGVYNM